MYYTVLQSNMCDQASTRATLLTCCKHLLHRLSPCNTPITPLPHANSYDIGTTLLTQPCYYQVTNGTVTILYTNTYVQCFSVMTLTLHTVIANVILIALLLHASKSYALQG